MQIHTYSTVDSSTVSPHIMSKGNFKWTLSH